MKKILYSIGLILVITGCSIDSSDFPTLEVGQDFVNSNVRLLVIDTFTVKLSTLKFDSINTSSSNRLLVGQYFDDYVGKVSSSAYFELSPQNYRLPEDAELDSVALILGYDRYFYNDTTLVSRIQVHQLSEDVESDEDIFYNTSKLKYDSVPLVIRNYRPEPFDEDSLHISIPNDFGQPIFDGIQENEIQDIDELRKLFKGITLQPGANENNSIIGFSRDPKKTYLRLYYSVPEEFEDAENFLDLAIFSTSSQAIAFNGIVGDVTGNILETLTNQEIDLPSTSSQNLSFIQSGIGYATKIEFPNIKKIFDIDGTGSVLSATLELKPPSNSYDDMRPLRDSLDVNILDSNNVIVGQLSNVQGPIQGRITGEREEFSNVIYRIPVGVYIDQKLSEDRDVEDAIVVFAKDYNSTINRIVLQGEENKDFKAKLILTYAIYDE